MWCPAAPLKVSYYKKLPIDTEDTTTLPMASSNMCLYPVNEVPTLKKSPSFTSIAGSTF